MKQSQALLRYPLPKISDFQNHRVACMLKMDARIRGAGMAMHVGQALLQDTEKSDLYVSRQSLTRFRDVCLYANPATLGEALDVALGRGCKSYLVQ